MKTVKSLLLGSAAGFVAFTGAQAADLPMAEPVEYVRVCDTYGSGFFYIPGTETCLRISGYVRFDQWIDVTDAAGVATGFAAGADASSAGLLSDNDYNPLARASFRADTRTETEYGTLRSFWEVRFNNTTGNATSTDVEQAFIQFAGFTIGKAQ